MRVRLCALFGAAFALNLTALLGIAAAPSARAAGEPPSETPEARSQLGSYLAGRLAGKQLDLPAAAMFYGKALQDDPDSAMLLDSALQMEASQGDWARAETLAGALIKVEPTNRVAQVLLGITAFKAGRYAEAD